MIFCFRVKHFLAFYLIDQIDSKYFFISDYILTFVNISTIKFILFNLCPELVVFHIINFTIKGALYLIFSF